MGNSAFKMRLRICFKKAHFWLKTFFSWALRKFSMHHMTMFYISRRSALHSKWIQYKNQKRTTRQTDYTIENIKSLYFWKFNFENGVGKLCNYASQNLIFDSKLFFQMAVKNFLHTLPPCSEYSEGLPKLGLYASNNIKSIRRTDEKILTKIRKKTF